MKIEKSAFSQELRHFPFEKKTSKMYQKSRIFAFFPYRTPKLVFSMFCVIRGHFTILFNLLDP